MKRFIFSIALVWLIGLGVVGAATIVVDGACAVAGNGTGGYTATCDGTAAGNPATTPAQALAAAACGDTIQIRGVHATHDSGGCPGSDGRYFEQFVIDVSGKACSSGSPLIIEAYGWTAPRAFTQEKVYIENSSQPTWTQCSDCTASGDCPNVPGTCAETWWADGSGVYSEAPYAVKPDGSPTWTAETRAALTNSHGASYNDKTCSTDDWIRCYVDADCPSGQSCNGTSEEVDSWRATGNCSTTTTQYCNCPASGCANPSPDCPGVETCNTATTDRLFVRWGTDGDCSDQRCAPTTSGFKSRIINHNGQGIRIQTSSYITVRGFNVRTGANAGIVVNEGNSNITIDDNRVYYRLERSAGSSYGIDVVASQDVTVSNNEVGFTGSENHFEAITLEAATRYLVQNNWVHFTGDQRVIGTDVCGTPQAFIFAEKAVDKSGNYTGSIAEGNIIEHLNSEMCSGVLKNGGTGFSLENYSSGWIIRNNIIRDMASACILFRADGTHINAAIDNTEIYNNIFYQCGLNPAGLILGACIHFHSSTGDTINNTKIYNNDFLDCKEGALEAEGADIVDGSMTNLTVQNNIIWQDPIGPYASKLAVKVQDATITGAFRNNLVVTTANPAANWIGTTKACSLLSDLGTGNVNNCPDPKFSNSTLLDFHLQTSSPAKDVGSATGMPTGKTRSIDNPLASRHGLPQYNGIPQIGSAWDIGACEYRKRRYFNISEFRWKRPEPWRITNAAYLRKIEKED